tara:strand:+ start:763 stop:1116 length:354 start_codon:yes stop_codon:yes gene_type:complete
MELELTDAEMSFVDQYIATAEWADPAEPEYYTDPDKVVRCPAWEREAILDCLAFWSKFEVYLAEPTQAAHDLYLSRNGHGTGFWDDNGENYQSWLAPKMQAFAEALGEHQIQYEEEI